MPEPASSAQVRFRLYGGALENPLLFAVQTRAELPEPLADAP
jgi:hypothetical protein